MSDRNAYEDEMRLRRPYDTDDPEFSSLAEELRSACLGAPGPEVQTRHIQAIVEQSRRIPEVPNVAPAAVGRRSRPLGVLVRLGAAAAVLALLTGSLALAGVDIPILPDIASDNAGHSREVASTTDVTEDDENRSETAQRVQATIQANLPLLHAGDISGCEFGAMVSAAARGVEPDTSRCEKDDSAEGEESGSGRSETAQRVQATIDANLPLLHAGDISGCEFGAMVSAAARGVEPDTSRCEKANVKAEADQPDSKAEKKKGGSAETSAPSKNTGPKQSKSKETAGGGAAGSPDEPGATANKKDKAKADDTGDVEAPGQSKGKGAPPAGKPGGKSDGD